MQKVTIRQRVRPQLCLLTGSARYLMPRHALEPRCRHHRRHRPAGLAGASGERGGPPHRQQPDDHPRPDPPAGGPPAGRADFADREVRDWFEEMSLRIDAVGRLPALLRAADGAAVVDLATYLREVAQAAIASLSHADGTDVSCDLLPACEIPAKQGAGIGLLVTEAMTNAFKYSHPSGVPGKLTITARRRRDGGLVIEIADDGVGLPEGFDPQNGKSNGFRLMRAAADQLRGRLAFEQTSRGLRVRLEMPHT